MPIHMLPVAGSGQSFFASGLLVCGAQTRPSGDVGWEPIRHASAALGSGMRVAYLGVRMLLQSRGSLNSAVILE